MSSPEPRRRLPYLLVLLTVLVAGAVGCGGEKQSTGTSTEQPAPRVELSTVLAAVRKAPAIRTVPPDLTPSIATAGDDMGFDNEKCEVAPQVDRMPDPCVFGDPASAFRVVLYGDSHAGMWLPAMMPIAQRREWRLEFYGKPACPTPKVTFWNEQERRPFTECDRFRDFVLSRFQADPPDLVVVTNESFGRKLDRGEPITASQWQEGLRQTLATMRRAVPRVIVLGDTPVLDESAPDCLAAHGANLAACFTTRAKATERVWNDADKAAAEATGSGYIPVLPWLCSAVCTPVIGNVVVYRNRFHLSATYARMLNGVLEDALFQTHPADQMP
ncbi:SGNH hydrolase domain-containing protein [Paractinoplanes rishiriensis]|uniref:SGNH domain-containing protein n=1 Tax=Paractinoplanes rishiriensis TaxID=1050105 RepID=A0A919K0G8_9ACTN|nr:SGNH hydrolase domain-containing protein [Actinoplanes rishiriensis]GIE96627.1 hypothetical protein Ari01nite_40920 [Actinoplanes rishiriensis]